MQVSDTISLVKIGTRCQDDHVGGGLSVNILISNGFIRRYRHKCLVRVKGHKLAPSIGRGSEGDSALASSGLELNRSKGSRHVPHEGAASTVTQTVVVCSAGIIQAESQDSVPELQQSLIVDGDIVQSG